MAYADWLWRTAAHSIVGMSLIFTRAIESGAAGQQRAIAAEVSRNMTIAMMGFRSAYWRSCWIVGAIQVAAPIPSAYFVKCIIPITNQLFCNGSTMRNLIPSPLRCSPQLSAVFLHDTARHRQSQAGAAFPGGIIGLEDLIMTSGATPWPVSITSITAWPLPPDAERIISPHWASPAAH